MPLGITTCSKQIEIPFHSAEPYKTFFHGHSYTANPIACAAANASFELLIHPSCRQSIERIESQHRDFASKIRTHRSVKEVRTLGTILAVEILTAESTSYFNNLKKILYSFFLERNILIRPLGNVIYILPPYVITEKELQQIYDAVEECMDYLASR